MKVGEIMEYNLDNITIQDCLDVYEKKGMITIINNGHVDGFIKED